MHLSQKTYPAVAGGCNPLVVSGFLSFNNIMCDLAAAVVLRWSPGNGSRVLCDFGYVQRWFRRPGKTWEISSLNF